MLGGGQPPAPPTDVEQVIAAADAHTITEQVGGATATIVVSESIGKAVVRTDNMPNAPAGQDFQLWLVSGEHSTSAGLMPYSDDGSNELVLSGDFASVDAVTITVEPKGGFPEPTTDPIAVLPIG